MELIILAGGLGTRLRSKVKDIPKSMADLKGLPFLEYQLNYFVRRGVTKIILSVGYKSEIIQAYFGEAYQGVPLVYSKEEMPLGTGGAVRKAMDWVHGEEVLVANGDSIFGVDLEEFFVLHKKKAAAVSLCLKPKTNYERYGTVLIDDQKRITRFLEKQPTKQGLINAGLYLIHRSYFQNLSLPEKCSLERDLFEKNVSTDPFYGFESPGYFRDIGIPEDYEKAQTELGVLTKISKEWTLFLDRDGVVNKRIVDGYVTRPEEFEFLPGAKKALAVFSSFFHKIIVVTNQQGIGKGIFSEEDLAKIHRHMQAEIEASGGRIDAVYFAPDLAGEKNLLRKPKTGMGKAAQADFPEIDFNRSIMVGDSESDLEFARRLRMHSVFIDPSGTHAPKGIFSLPSLESFATLLNEIRALNIRFS